MSKSKPDLIRQIEHTQSFLLGYSWIRSGKDFFQELAEYLAHVLKADYVCIDRLLVESHEAQTIAIYFDGHFEDNVRYKLDETPCGKVNGPDVCFFPNNVRHLFPNDRVLQDMVAESYGGITIWGSNGNPIGLIAVISRKPLQDKRLNEVVLKQVTIRASSELEYRIAREAMNRSNAILEELVHKRTEELMQSNKRLIEEIDTVKQREEQLIIAEEKYRTVADNTYDWETWISPDGNYLYISPSCERISGYSVDEFLKDKSLIVNITHPQDRQKIEKHFMGNLFDPNHTCNFDFRIYTRGGEERWLAHSCHSVYDSNGNWVGYRGSNRDITSQKKAENVLISSKNYLRALTQRMDAITEEERINIAREIHDELGHVLTALKFDLENIASHKDFPSHLTDEMNSVLNMASSLIVSVQKISTELRPGILDHLGLFAAIEWEVRQFQKRTRICCKFTPPEEDFDFDKTETTLIYRILQEILTNVARHAKATHLEIQHYVEGDEFFIKVSDNGVGFNVDEEMYNTSLGLLGMRERALRIGGEIMIESQVGKGTSVTFHNKRKEP